jgi:hypothetical protein
MEHENQGTDMEIVEGAMAQAKEARWTSSKL